jgi:hypothetical protein
MEILLKYADFLKHTNFSTISEAQIRWGLRIILKTMEDELDLFKTILNDPSLQGYFDQVLDTIKKSGACDPVETNSQMGKEFSIDHSPLDPNDIAVPCGLIARSLFNDTFKMYYRGLDGSLEEEIIINEKGIAWEEDVKLKYKNVKNPNNINDTNYYKKVQWIDMTDEHFIVWMRIAGLPNFRKLWGRIEGKQLEKGKYDIIINDNFKVSTFSGKKFFVLTTVNSFGGKNNFLGIAYIVIGCISLIFNFVFLIGFNIYKRKNV